MEINIQIIPHHDQRYETCGDYVYNPFTQGLDILISETGNQDYNFLISLHEMIEAYLCWKRKIDFDTITAFDIKFKGNGEPGDDPKSPYRKEHQFATKLERLMAKELGVKWKEYDSVINKL